VIEKIFSRPACGVFRIMDFGNFPALRVLVMIIERTQKNPISMCRECLIKFILMRVPIENGLGFVNQGIRFY